MSKEVVFKTCKMCGKNWFTRDQFWKDPHILLLGYQAHFADPEKGLLLFEHHEQGCGTTIALRVQDFADLFTGTRYPELKRDFEECPGYCLDEKNFKRCRNQCSMAFAREIVHSIQSGKSHVGAV